MAGDAGPWIAYCSQGGAGGLGVDYHIHHHHTAHAAVCLILDQSDFYDELYYPVRSPTPCLPRPPSMLFPYGRLLTGRTATDFIAPARSMLILLAFASLVSWIVRYRFLNMYDRLPPAPERKEPHIDLFADTQGDTKPGLANYLDEFLSAIKVFGYRE